jgi:hypothetical protein
MKRMRWHVIVLVLWLTLLFNIERLDFDQVDLDQVVTVNLASYFYILIAATVALFLFVPFRRSQMYLASLGVLSIYTVVGVLEPAISFTGVAKYLRITEIVALLITIGLTWLVSQALQDFMEAVEAISLPEGRPRLLSLDKFHERIRAELGRARRHQDPISVSMIELNPSTFEASLHQAVRDAQAAMTKRYVQVRFGVFLAKQIRETDAIATHDKDGRFLILAPQATAAQMTAMLKRLEHNVARQMDVRFRYSTADFPNAALTSEELISKAAEELQNQGMLHDDYQNGAQSKPVVAAKEADTNGTTSSRRVDSLDEMITTQMKSNHEAGNGAKSQNGR